jgi:hypothetical protein
LAEEWIIGSPSLARRIADRLPDDHWTRAMAPTGPPHGGRPTSASPAHVGHPHRRPHPLRHGTRRLSRAQPRRPRG